MVQGATLLVGLLCAACPISVSPVILGEESMHNSRIEEQGNLQNNRNEDKKQRNAYAISQTKDDKLRIRHAPEPINKRAETDYISTLQTEWMQSPCRPEPNGYFGSTPNHVETTTFSYSFEMEQWAENGAQRKLKILRILNDVILDAILAHTFPSVCSFGDSEETTLGVHSGTSENGTDFTVTGFRFDYSVENLKDCPSTVPLSNAPTAAGSESDSSASASTDCDVYESSIQVFGDDSQHSVPTLNAVLRNAFLDGRSKLDPYGVARLQFLGSVIRLVQQGTSQPEDPRQNWGLLIGFSLLCVALIGGMVVLLWWYRLRQEHYRYYSNSKSGNSSKRSRGSTAAETSTWVSGSDMGSLLYFTSTGSRRSDRHHRTPSETSSVPTRLPPQPYSSSRQQGSRSPPVLLGAQKRVVIEFDPKYIRYFGGSFADRNDGNININDINDIKDDDVHSEMASSLAPSSDRGSDYGYLSRPTHRLDHAGLHRFEDEYQL